jgi:hypothetical protein
MNDMNNMKAFHIDGIRDLIIFCLFVLVAMGLVLGLPTAFVWVAWNGIVGDVAGGPYIALWQAVILTAALFVLFYIVARPDIQFEIKHTDSPDDTPKPNAKS